MLDKKPPSDWISRLTTRNLPLEKVRALVEEKILLPHGEFFEAHLEIAKVNKITKISLEADLSRQVLEKMVEIFESEEPSRERSIKIAVPFFSKIIDKEMNPSHLIYEDYLRVGEHANIVTKERILASTERPRLSEKVEERAKEKFFSLLQWLENQNINVPNRVNLFNKEYSHVEELMKVEKKAAVNER